MNLRDIISNVLITEGYKKNSDSVIPIYKDDRIEAYYPITEDFYYENLGDETALDADQYEIMQGNGLVFVEVKNPFVGFTGKTGGVKYSYSEKTLLFVVEKVGSDMSWYYVDPNQNHEFEDEKLVDFLIPKSVINEINTFFSSVKNKIKTYSVDKISDEINKIPKSKILGSDKDWVVVSSGLFNGNFDTVKKYPLLYSKIGIGIGDYSRGYYLIFIERNLKNLIFIHIPTSFDLRADSITNFNYIKSMKILCDGDNVIKGTSSLSNIDFNMVLPLYMKFYENILKDFTLQRRRSESTPDLMFTIPELIKVGDIVYYGNLSPSDIRERWWSLLKNRKPRVVVKISEEKGSYIFSVFNGRSYENVKNKNFNQATKITVNKSSKSSVNIIFKSYSNI